METYQQVAALPYVYVKGSLYICLITSRETKRLVIPKGWPKPGVTGHQMAYQEANEEAGLVGEISDQSIGTFEYKKKLHTFAVVNCVVDVFPLHVTQQMIRYSENNQRELFWMETTEAANSVDEPELKTLITNLSSHLVPARKKPKKKKAS